MANEYASLILKVNSDGVDKATKRLGAFDRAAGRAENSADEFSKSQIGMKTKAAAATIAIVALAAALATLKSNLDSIDNLAKVSDKLGIATEKLQAMRLQAELTGVSARTLDMGLQRMVRRVAEAAQGTGEAEGALRELGVSAKELAKLSPDEQFKTIADAMGQVKDQGDKVRLSMKLFDSEGVALVNTLNAGSDALRETEKEMTDLGIAINRIDAKKVEDANDAMTHLKTSVGALGQTFTIAIAPAIQVAADALNALNKQFLKFISSVNTAKTKELAGQLKDLRIEAKAAFATGDIDAQRDALGRVVSRIEEIRGEFAKFRSESDKGRLVGVSPEALHEMRKELSQLGMIRTDLQKSIFGVGTAAAQGTKDVVSEFIDNYKKAQDEIRKALFTPDPEKPKSGSKESKENEAFQEALIQRWRDQMDFEAQQEQSRRESLQDVKQFLMTESELYQQAYDNRYQQIMETTEAGTKLQQDLIMRLNEKFQNEFERKAQANAERIAQGLENEFAVFLFDRFEKGLDGMLDGFITMLRRMAAEAAAAQIFQALGGNNAFGTIVGAVGSAFAGGGSGGTVTESSPGFVGPPSSAAGRSAQGGKTVVINQNFSGVQNSQDIKRSASQAAAQAAKAVRRGERNL